MLIDSTTQIAKIKLGNSITYFEGSFLLVEIVIPWMGNILKSSCPLPL